MATRLALLAFCLLMAGCGAPRLGCPLTLPADLAAKPSGCLRLAVVPTARQYAAGMDKLTFKTTATNVSAQPCAGSGFLLCGGPALTVSDASGHAVWSRQRPPVACPLLVRLLQPGESMSGSVDWDKPAIGPGTFFVEGAQQDFGRAYFSVC